MKQDPIIAKIEVHEFEWQLADVGLDLSGAIPTYRPGDTYTRQGRAVRIHTDAGIVGEFAPAGAIPRNVGALIGRSVFERERIYRDLKLAGTAGLGSVDVALWDIAGKFYDAPIYKLLGAYRKKLPCYASTMNGADEGALSTPESFADFAQECRELGYPAFKIHPWPGGPIQRHVDVVLAVRRRVGDEMDLMLDPFCYYETFGEALKVGRACDEAEFFWLEDPYADGGVSHSGHRKLRELIRTPLLQGEKVPGFEMRVNLMLAQATDYIRGDPQSYGITATAKLAHAAEGMGLDIEYHGCGPVQRHMMAATRNSNYYEVVWVHPDIPVTAPPIYADGYEDGLYAVDGDGCVSVPEGPGLGVEYDWDWIMKHRTGGAEYTD